MTKKPVELSKWIVLEKSVIAIQSTIMSQLLRFISLSFLIFVSFLSYGQCPDKGFTPGQFSITGTTGGISVNGDGDGLATSANNTVLRICEGESIVLAKTAATVGTVGGVNYWLVDEGLFNSATYGFPSSPATSFANYDPSLGATSTQITLNTANLPGFSSPSPYKYNGPGRYLLIQKDQSYIGGTPDNYYACQVIEIISPTITKPNFTLSRCIDGSAVVSLPTDASNNVFYNYDIVYKDKATGGAFPSSTGLVTSYPKHITQFISSTTKNYEITVTGQTQTGGCVGATGSPQDITVKKASNPKAGLITGQATNGTYEIEFVAEAGVKREVFIREASGASSYNFSSTPFTNFVSVSANSTLIPGFEKMPTLATVPNPDKQYCFMARAAEANTLCPTTTSPVTSDVETCTTTLKAVSGDKKNSLTWSPFVTGMLGGTFLSYKIYREGTNAPIKTITVAGTTSYDDDDASSLVCGTKYNYKVVTDYGAVSTSSPIEVEFKQTTAPVALNKVFVSVSDDNTYVTIDGSLSTTLPTGGSPKYHFFRTKPTVTEFVDGNSSFQDFNVNTAKEQYCYQMTWNEGACIQSTKSNEVCTILLKKNGTNLEWTPESPMVVAKGGYEIEHAPDPNSGFISSSSFFPYTAGPNTMFDLTSIPSSAGLDFYLRIGVRPATGLGAISYSNRIHYERPIVVLVPQIFTPDGNSLNETFDIQGRYIRKTKMWIYDRWGSPIYYKETDTDQTDSATGLWIDTGWDGTLSNGQKAPQGNYVYKVEIEDSVGKISIKSGALILAY